MRKMRCSVIGECLRCYVQERDEQVKQGKYVSGCEFEDEEVVREETGNMTVEKRRRAKGEETGTLQRRQRHNDCFQKSRVT